jgi:hypothetical protein
MNIKCVVFIFNSSGVVHALLEAGADVNIPDTNGTTPVHEAGAYHLVFCLMKGLFSLNSFLTVV